MTLEQFERKAALSRRLRGAVEECVVLASALRSGPSVRWSVSLVVDARRLLTTVEYFEQEQRRLAAEVARTDERVTTTAAVAAGEVIR